ncbi:MAG: bifunctional phosphoglucose/phosphomannose isomerase [Acidimicrobiia bacterium]|nr:bifunctional phosphoglucose/phosphomannose isomerase [Acidimicrobiia bacterium]
MSLMRRLIDELPAQLRWAAAAEVPELALATEGLVLGMGGSGFAGDVAAVFAEAQGVRVAVHKGYGLPGWAAAGHIAVVAVSHSGNTEETLSGVEAAHTAGLAVAATATGGVLAQRASEWSLPYLAVPPGAQPRAAAGYLAGATLRLLESAGVVTGTVAALTEAADVAEALLAGDAPAVAGEVAASLRGRIGIIYGSGPLTAAAAGRWKAQLNENGKVPAWWSVLPELDHNEIVGWAALPAIGSDAVGVVFLHDGGEDARTHRRAQLTAELMAPVHVAGTVASRGAGPLARLFSLVVVGDLVSVAVAEQAGIDPVPVAVIERLKKALAE